MSNSDNDFGDRFVPLRGGWGVQPIEKLEIGGDVHDTFQVNETGNVSGGHSTVRLPDKLERKMDW